MLWNTVKSLCLDDILLRKYIMRYNKLGQIWVKEEKEYRITRFDMILRVGAEGLILGYSLLNYVYFCKKIICSSIEKHRQK